MCGVAGALSFANSSFSVSATYLERMRDTMRHRGPDGAGVWVSPDGRVGLGHRRLAIVDLSETAAQPIPLPRHFDDFRRFAGLAGPSPSRPSISRASARYACAPADTASYSRIGRPKLGASASRTLRGMMVR